MTEIKRVDFKNEFKITFKHFLEYKKMIFILTAFFALVAIFYVQTIQATFIAKSKFILPAEELFLDPNLESVSSLTFFNSFLSTLSSKIFQEEVFINGDYFSKFEGEGDLKSYVRALTSSIALTLPVSRKLGGNLFDESYVISMSGSNGKLSTLFIEDLVETARKKTADEVTLKYLTEAQKRLAVLKFERKISLQQSQDQVELNLNLKREAAEMARVLGFPDNNFRTVGSETSDKALSLLFGSIELPEWYVYGENALREQISIIESRDLSFIRNPELDYKIRFLEEYIKLDQKVNVMILTQSASFVGVSLLTKKIIALLLSTLCGFLLGIFLSITAAIFKE